MVETSYELNFGYVNAHYRQSEPYNADNGRSLKDLLNGGHLSNVNCPSMCANPPLGKIPLTTLKDTEVDPLYLLNGGVTALSYRHIQQHTSEEDVALLRD